MISLPAMSQSKADSARKADSVFIAQEIKSLTAELAQLEESIKGFQGLQEASASLITEIKNHTDTLGKQIDSLRILKKKGRYPDGGKVNPRNISGEIKWRELRIKLDRERAREMETLYKEMEADILKAEAMVNKLRQQLKELKEYTGM